MKVRALRGVCIGVDRHLKAGDTEDLDAALVTFLVGIGAVERVAETIQPEPEPQAEPVSEAAESEHDSESHKPRRRGK